MSGLLPATATSRDLAVSRSGDALGYSGDLTITGLETLKRVWDPEVRTLRVRSPGGSVREGMVFGDWVRARGLDVEVVDYCLSSCANYVFPAGRRKTILPGAVVAWHGDAHQRMPSDSERMAHLAPLRAQEDEFFARLGVVECLCRIGDERLGARGFYTMTAADLRRFGVNDVLGAPADAESDAEPMRSWVSAGFVTVPASMDVVQDCAATDAVLHGVPP